MAAERGGTTICCTRYGNVMCSRGSVIPLFIDQIRAGNPITITDPNMTRFLMNLDEAVDLVMFAFEHANPGDLFIQKSDASTIGDLAKAVQQLFGDTGTNIIGTRHGEKLFETLMTREERLRSEDELCRGLVATNEVLRQAIAANDQMVKERLEANAEWRELQEAWQSSARNHRKARQAAPPLLLKPAARPSFPPTTPELD